MGRKPFRSTGTIRVRSELGQTPEVFFTPSPDLTVRDRGKQYAVFIRGDGDNACLRIKLPDSGEGIPIRVKVDLPGLVETAARQISVEVEVAAKLCKSNLVLRAITIPAPGKKK